MPANVVALVLCGGMQPRMFCEHNLQGHSCQHRAQQLPGCSWSGDHGAQRVCMCVGVAQTGRGSRTSPQVTNAGTRAAQPLLRCACVPSRTRRGYDVEGPYCALVGLLLRHGPHPGQCLLLAAAAQVGHDTCCQGGRRGVLQLLGHVQAA
jgi:hypothetical protein